MTIFTSYPMYFDALRTIINSKNQKSIFLWPFWPQNWSLLPKSVSDRQIEGKSVVLGPKWSLNDTFLIFRVYNRSQRIEIHRIRCKNRHILKFYF